MWEANCPGVANNFLTFNTMETTNKIPAEVTAKKEWSTPELTSLSVALNTFAVIATGTDGATVS